MKLLIQPLLLLTLAITLGCTRPNPYSNFYHSTGALPTVYVPEDFETVNGPARIYSYSSNITQDNQAMLENGYIEIGYSSFNGSASSSSESDIQKQASVIGASVVLVKSAYTNTRTGSIPYTVQNPGQTIYSNSTGTANTYGSGGWATGTYSGSTTTYVPGGTSNYSIPYSVDRYDFGATYWIRKTRIHFGAYYSDLPNQLRASLQRNRGVLITLIIKRTPAWDANLLPGDVVIRLNGRDVTDAQEFTSLLTGNAGQSIALDIVRNGENKSILLHENS
ncbi:MAG TPA: PDZ domain-containing protein [Holophagaceae bacterium]|nr:PDZ domain-containing protein [Holophagaceae bacterium]